jgi:hypothetical protein
VNTVFLLMAEFGQADIPLEQVAAKYLGLDAAHAKRQAASQALPFPVYRAGSQKSPWMVRVSDLAEYLDKCRENAKREWEAVSGARGP